MNVGSPSAPGRFDALVLGGGAAGCVAAARLSEDSERTVCLVEAGPDYGPHAAGRWPADLLDARDIPFSHSWAPADVLPPAARVIGGCSSHNACFVQRGPASDYDGWEAAGNTGWSNAGLDPYLERARRMLAPRNYERAELAPWHGMVLEAVAQLGMPVVEDIDSVTGPAGATGPVNVRGTTRWNAAFAYLDPARGRPNLTVLGETLVDRLVVRDGVVTGAAVLTASGRATLTGDTVVLAGGAYGTPAILLRSGIGPEPDLAALGIETVLPLDGVGGGLVDHPAVRVQFECTQRFHTDSARHEATGRLFHGACCIRAASAGCEPDRCDLFLLAISTPDGDGRYGSYLTAVLLAPRSRGTVRLRSSDPEQTPLVDSGLLSDHDGHDIARLAEAAALARRIAGSPSGKAYVAREDPASNGLEGEPLREWMRSGVFELFHPTGTCRMGSVTGPNGRVHGLENCFVADASLMPAIPRATPHLSVLAIAERVAEGLRARA